MKYELERIKATNSGRYLVKVPPGYPGKVYQNKYVYEHRAVWWLHHGSLPPQDWHIHHINHDPLDNRIENLEAISALEHSKQKHNGGKDPVQHVELICHYCKKPFQKLVSSEQENFYCSKSCQVILKNMNRKGSKNNYPKNRKSNAVYVTLKCPVCSVEFQRPERVIRDRKKAGVTNFYCSNPCIARRNR
jgi:hypothetical protein